VRTALLLEHQTDTARKVIHGAIVQAAERLRGADGIELANPALLVTAKAV
jgi:hypothetical protein